MRVNAVALSLILLVGAATPSAAESPTPAPSVRIRTLNYNRDVYDGKEVRVVGRVSIFPESHVITAVNYRQEEKVHGEESGYMDAYCLTIENPGFFLRFAHVPMDGYFVVQGVFHKLYRRPGELDLGGCEDVTGLRVTSARMLPNQRYVPPR